MENLRGAKIVKQDSLMVENSHLYIKAKDSEYCELTILDENGKKRNVGAYNVDLSNYYTKTETYSQKEINDFLSEKQNSIGYTPENVANKSDSYTLSSSTTYASTKALVDGLATKLDKGINHTWSPTNRTLTLFDREGNQLSQVSLVSLDNEGTDIRYNASTLSLELYNADNELLDSIPVSSFIGSVGTQLQLNSNELQLRDSQGNVLSTVNFAVSNIQGLQTVLDGKLNKPTNTSNTTSYPFVVGEDGNGNSARLPAGDLGKNFFNSDLSNTTARNHTMNAGVTINTLGNPHTLSGLPNKNTDIANFRKVRVQNASGLDAVVDSKNLLTDGVNSMTVSEKALLRQYLSDNSTLNVPQVDLIMMHIVEKKDEIQYLTLYGFNLNLSQIAGESSIFLKNVSTGSETLIPNAQIDTVNGRYIIIPFNFNNYDLGSYRFRIVNKGTETTTQSSFELVSAITHMVFSDNVWDVVNYNNGINDTSSITTYSVGLSADNDVKTLANENVFVQAVKSKELANMSENFYIEFRETLNTAVNLGFTLVGFTFSNKNSLIADIFAGIKHMPSYYTANINDGNYSASPSIGVPNTFILQKKGSVMTTILQNSAGRVINILSGVSTNSSDKIYLKALIPNRGNIEHQISLQFIKGFKI